MKLFEVMDEFTTKKLSLTPAERVNHITKMISLNQDQMIKYDAMITDVGNKIGTYFASAHQHWFTPERLRGLKNPHFFPVTRTVACWDLSANPDPTLLAKLTHLYKRLSKLHETNARLTKKREQAIVKRDQMASKRYRK